jgi:hypothetical protein
VIRPAKSAQDGWNEHEKNVYREMWDGAFSVITPEAKTIRIGAAQLARISELGKTTVRRVLQSLLKKGDIEIERPPDYETPTTYRVYSYSRILERRKLQGLVYRRKRPKESREVHLITRDEMLKLWGSDERIELREEDEAAVFELTTLSSSPLSSKPPSEVTASKPHTQKVTQKEKRSKYSAEELSAIAIAIADLGEGHATAPKQILDADRKANPAQNLDVTVAKVAHLMKQIRASKGGIHTPVGFITATIGEMEIDMQFEKKKASAASTKREAEAIAKAAKEEADADRAKLLKAITPEQTRQGAEAWTRLQHWLSQRILKQSYETWIKPTSGISLKGKILLVQIPLEEFSHIGEKYAELIEEAIKELRLKITSVEYITAA